MMPGRNAADDHPDIFTPCETIPDRDEIISAGDLGYWGDQAVLEPAWNALETAESAESFYRAAAALVFHARHLHPMHHTRLARMLLHPFKRPNGRPEAYERSEDIEMAITSAGRALVTHEWQNLSRVEMIAAIGARYGLTEDAARKAYDKAKRAVTKRQARPTTASGKKPADKSP
jgi:hypothetical protein